MLHIKEFFCGLIAFMSLLSAIM